MIPSTTCPSASHSAATGTKRSPFSSSPIRTIRSRVLSGLPRRHARVGAATAEEDHALVSFTDPFALESCARREVGGLPDLVEQVRHDLVRHG
jgi:hypothetical protein